MALYSVSKLMSETRRLACEYYQTTGQILPITQELAKYDAISLLNLEKPEGELAAVDAVGKDGVLTDKVVLIKGRVILPKQKTGHRIGQLNVKANWDYLALVIYDETYKPEEIYCISKEMLNEILEAKQKQNKRGMLSVKQIKTVGFCAWEATE